MKFIVILRNLLEFIQVDSKVTRPAVFNNTLPLQSQVNFTTFGIKKSFVACTCHQVLSE